MATSTPPGRGGSKPGSARLPLARHALNIAGTCKKSPGRFVTPRIPARRIRVRGSRSANSIELSVLGDADCTSTTCRVSLERDPEGRPRSRRYMHVARRMRATIWMWISMKPDLRVASLQVVKMEEWCRSAWLMHCSQQQVDLWAHQ